MTSKYLPQIILACAFTSVSIHLLNQRRDSEGDRRRHSAQITALEEVVRRQQDGEQLTDAELLKIRRRVGLVHSEGNTTASNALSSRWSIMNRRESKDDTNDDQVHAEWNKSKHFELFLNYFNSSIVVQEAAQETDSSPSLLRALIRQNAPLTTTAETPSTKQSMPQRSPSHQPDAKKPFFY